MVEYFRSLTYDTTIVESRCEKEKNGRIHDHPTFLMETIAMIIVAEAHWAKADDTSLPVVGQFDLCERGMFNCRSAGDQFFSFTLPSNIQSSENTF